MEFPLGVFGIALATVILPSLSRKHAAQSSEEFSETLDWALRLVLLIVLPAALGLAILAGPMLTTIFQYGEFSASDVHKASLSLMAYAVGLPGFVYIKVLAPGFFARQDTRTPVRVGVVAMLANIVLNLVLVVPLAHAGLALATSLSAFLNAGLLYKILRKEGVYRPRPGWGAFALRVLAANVLMTLLLLWGHGELSLWLEWDLYQRVWKLGLLIVGGVATYFLALSVMGFRMRALLVAGGR